jgi:hypothetical protein
MDINKQHASSLIAMIRVLSLFLREYYDELQTMSAFETLELFQTFTLDFIDELNEQH